MTKDNPDRPREMDDRKMALTLSRNCLIGKAPAASAARGETETAGSLVDGSGKPAQVAVGVDLFQHRSWVVS
ncbi:hypothetical protein [Pseudofrankia sp. BMG5.37]|uniref:hypothetical protein n=1 Tax=Pseudofrankia sp. BMG5.37 TaxID=3050035 RepID=UPI0028946F92|nr:hypothetical protein [Pseudofrankia sp. BMG5.37]MDT3439221.1 hypothetical protein [Pseudofrankia sp. BMG5.37]